MIFKDYWVLLGIPALAILAFFPRERLASLRFSSLDLFGKYTPTLRQKLARWLIYLRIAALGLFIIALARPQMPLTETKVNAEGIDIVLALDSSGSMLAEDFLIGNKRYNRLAIVKRVVEDFIRKRDSDRIGMVAFAARAYTVCPLTLDYDWLIRNLERVKIGTIEDGTAIGSAIATSLNRLKNSDAKSKVIILLTDGVNNTGDISPLTAAQMAQALGVKIYTIGAGSKNEVPYPVQDFWGNTVYQNVKIELDEKTLKAIADTTGGAYFRATDTESLKAIYTQIDAMEKTRVQAPEYKKYKELFPGFVFAGILFLLSEVILSRTWLVRLP